MKAEELMIGDWVYYSSKKHIVQVVGISGIQYSFNQQDVILYGDCFKDFDGRRRWESHTTKSLSPIPLTPEILEKNGFVESKEKSNIEDIGCAIIYGKYKRFDSDNCLNYGDSLYPIKYVHQLQHALKLCGINKEIVL